jgi:hypothetical protein
MFRRFFLILAALAAPLLAQDLIRLPPPPVDSAAVRDSVVRADSLKAKAYADTSGDTVAYSAARIRFRDDRFSLAEGALLKYKGATLRADSIVYYSEDDVVDAFGAPVIEDPSNSPILGYRMRYNLKNRVGTLYYGSSTKDGQTFNGVEVRRQPDTDIYVARGDLSTCDDKTHQHYYFYARRMIIEPESKVLSGPIVMNIADVPLAVLPMMVMPLGKGRRSGILQPKFGGDQSQGFYLQGLGYYWAISDYQDFKLSGDIVEGASGTFDQTNFETNYQWNKRYVWSGNVASKIYVPEFQPANAGGYVDFSNDLNLTPDGRQTLKGSGRIQSDPGIVQNNALNEEEQLQQTANANLGYRRQFDWNQATLNLNMAQEYNLTQEYINRDLPTASFQASGALFPAGEDSEPSADGSEPWYRKLEWSYNNRFNVNQVIRPTFNGARGDSTTYAGYADNASLSGKYTALQYFNVTPSVSGYQLWSAGERGDSANPYRNAFSPGSGSYGQYFAGWRTNVTADTRIFGIAQASDAPWFGAVVAARHTLTPSVGFTYAPEIDSNPSFFPNPKIGGTAYQAEERTVGFGLSNDVDLKLAPADSGKKPESYKLLSANSGISYNFASPVRPWTDLTSSISLYLTRNVAFTLSATHGVYDDFTDSASRNDETSPILKSFGFGWRKGLEIGGGLNSGLRIRDTQGAPTDRFEQSPWSASLNYNFAFGANRVGTSEEGNPAERFFGTSEIFEMNKSHSATAGFKLSPTQEWKMSYDTEFNFTEGNFSRHSFAFERTLHCWQMNFTWTPTGVSEGWYFVIRIIDLPDVKLETRDTRNLRG